MADSQSVMISVGRSCNPRKVGVLEQALEHRPVGVSLLAWQECIDRRDDVQIVYSSVKSRGTHLKKTTLNLFRGSYSSVISLLCNQDRMSHGF